MIENYSKDIIQSFEYETSINSDGNVLGTCELGTATIQMINDSNTYSSLKGKWIKTIHGSFYIYDVEPVQEKVNIKLSCYDIKYKLDTKYDSSLYTFPMTLKEWRNAIFTSCGVEYDDTDFPNSDLSLSSEPYVGDNPSNRQVISQIAQAGASFVITDENDKFYFKWFNNINHNITDWLELTTEKENTPAINVVVLGRGNVEDNVCYPDPLPENKVGLRIDNNYIIDPQVESNDIRYTTRVPIYNQVNGFSFIPFSIRTQEVNNKLSINIGDKVFYKDIWGNNLTSCVMTKKITYLGGDPADDDNYEITLSAEELNETSTEYSYASSIENRVSKVEITTDKQNKKINALVEEIDENTEKVSNLSLEVDKISSTVSSVENKTTQNASEISTMKSSVSELQQTDEEIKSSVSETKITLDGTVSSLNSLETKMTTQEATLNIVSKNIDKTTGDVREITTITGFTFNAEGSSIKDSDGYEILQTPKGAYYKDCSKIVGQYTKDGSKQKDLELFGTYSYGKEDIDDTPMFVAQLYTNADGEKGFGHFYNGGDY